LLTFFCDDQFLDKCSRKNRKERRLADEYRFLDVDSEYLGQLVSGQKSGGWRLIEFKGKGEMGKRTAAGRLTKNLGKSSQERAASTAG